MTGDWIDPQHLEVTTQAKPPSPPGTEVSTWGTVAGLETWTGQTISGAPATAQAEAALDAARWVVRDLTRQHLTKVADETLVMDWDGGVRVFLPEVPVVSITSLETRTGRGTDPQDDPDVWGLWNAADYEWSTRTGELRLLASSSDWGFCSPFLSGLRVVYTHGFDPMPADLEAVLYGMATRALAGAESGGTPVKAETLGGYSISYGDPSAPAGGSWASGLTGPEAAVLASYRIANRA